MEIIDTPINPVSLFLRSSSYSQAVNTTKTNLIFNLNEPIANYQNMDILIACESFQFTNSFYTINETNYKFIYKLLNGSAETVSVPYGYYDIDSLILKLNNLLTGIFTFSYNSLTYKTTITHNTGSQFILLDDGNNTNIYETLGIDDSGYTTYSSSYTSPYLLNLISVKVIHICIPNINIKSISLKNTKKYNIIASIQVVSQFGSVQTYFNTSNFAYKIGDDVIPFVNVIILNQDFNPVNFNNIDWFLNLSFKFIYRKELQLPTSLQDYQQDFTAKQELLAEEQRNYLNSLQNN